MVKGEAHIRGIRLLGMAGAEARISYVETLRGIACIALVAFHVIGNDPRGGLRLPEGHYLVFLVDLLADVRMPLFSFISGFVFWPVVRSAAELGPRILGKARRLLIPFVCVASLFWAAQSATGIEVPPFPEIFYLPYAHFWFLRATFLVMTAFYLLTWASGGRHVPVAVALGTIGGSWWILTGGWSPNIFSAYNALFLAPFFMVGYLAARSAQVKGTLDRLAAGRYVVPVAVAIGLGLLAVEVAINAGVIAPVGGERKAITVAVGLTACLTLFVLRPDVRTLATIGAYSYAIFLFHVFFTAATRMVLSRIWPGMPDPLAALAGIGAGLIGPMLLSELILRSRIARTLLLGLKLAPRRSWRAPGAPTAGP